MKKRIVFTRPMYFPKHIYLIALCFHFFLFVGKSVYAQAAPPEHLSGKELRVWLKENWYDAYHVSLGYNGAEGARGRMYNFIDNKNGVVETIYSGYETYLNYGGTETNPENGRVNAEHIVPQSFFRPENHENGAEPMRSDLHHLAPAFARWNSTRNNHPFDDIPDHEVSKWMIYDEEQNHIPNNPGLYSKYTSTNGQRFEPRDESKGNVVRAIMYFYTMYEDSWEVAIGIGGIINDLQLLADWNAMDPVDEIEQERNDLVATYQGNRNPYIDYPELVYRAWQLDDKGGGGQVTAVSSTNHDCVRIYPNPVLDSLIIQSESEAIIRIEILSISGQLLFEKAGSFAKYTLDISQFAKGVYVIKTSTEKDIYIHQILKK